MIVTNLIGSIIYAYYEHLKINPKTPSADTV